MYCTLFVDKVFVLTMPYIKPVKVSLQDVKKLEEVLCNMKLAKYSTHQDKFPEDISKTEGMLCTHIYWTSFFLCIQIFRDIEERSQEVIITSQLWGYRGSVVF